ncbi:GyrI-like small molecule binding domain-containing protein [Halodesulfovibrio aestuarii]|uniref:GyrI-like small molecule binding domain-containing protein n=2 Tax=Halodesulfovibrio aestuarii TaxID=126333 RepID=A0A8G2C6Z0_9BACT|nr:GyrI-like small molecule binding domain-containing protein [Halodesulfovibrio aestuarii]
MVIPESFRIMDGIDKRVIPEGRYASVTHRGPYETLYITYSVLFGEWLPQSGEELQDAPSLQIYLNNIDETPAEELLTEIRIVLQ